MKLQIGLVRNGLWFKDTHGQIKIKDGPLKRGLGLWLDIYWFGVGNGFGLTLVNVDQKVNCWQKTTFGQSLFFCIFLMYWTLVWLYNECDWYFGWNWLDELVEIESCVWTYLKLDWNETTWDGHDLSMNGIKLDKNWICLTKDYQA